MKLEPMDPILAARVAKQRRRPMIVRSKKCDPTKSRPESKSWKDPST
jgi:hypothetical protein